MFPCPACGGALENNVTFCSECHWTKPNIATDAEAMSKKATLETLLTEPTSSHVTSAGWFPDVALHRRGNRLVHESSYSFLVFAAVMCAVAVAVCFIPWDARAFIGIGPKVKFFIAGGFAWGGTCAAGAYWFRNVMGQRIVFDRDENTVLIRARDCRITIPRDDVLGVQLFRGKLGYQTNLVYRSESGGIARRCLLSHVNRGPCKNLARQYQDKCKLELFDHTELADS